MAEIFFIASDERALDLIESLRIESSKSLTFETDLPSAVRRLPKEKPRYVFIQSSLDGTSCEEIAAQAKALVAGEPPQLVLLRDEEAPAGPLPACFGCSIDLTLPTHELTNVVMRLLDGELPTEAPKAPDADLPDLFALEDATDFEIPSFDDAAFDPHLAPLWQPDHMENRLIFSDILPDEDATPTVLSPAAPVAAPNEPAEAPDDIVLFVPEPLPPAELESAEEAPLRKDAVLPNEMPSLWVEVPPIEVPPLWDEVPIKEAAPPTPTAPFEEEKPSTDAARNTKTPGRSLYPGPAQIYRKPPKLCGAPLEGEEEGAPGEPTVRGLGHYRRHLFVTGAFLLALGVLFWPRTPPSGPELAPKQADVSPAAPSAAPSTAPSTAPPAAPPVAPAKPAAVAPAAPATKPAPVAQPTQALPGFIPKAPADPAYAAKHPGWERYPGDKMQFRVFRENGAIKAIQVIGQYDAEISETLVRASFREATGSDLPAAGKVTVEKGVKVETRKADDGAEVAIYRSADNGRILGFVLQLADSKGKAK